LKALLIVACACAAALSRAQVPSIETTGDTVQLAAAKILLGRADATVDILQVVADQAATIAALLVRVQTVEDAAKAANHASQIDALTGRVASLEKDKGALTARVKTLEDAEAVQQQEKADEDASETAQAELLSGLAKRADEFDAALNQTNTALDATEEELVADVESLESRVSFLMEEFSEGKEFVEAVEHPGFEDADGNMMDTGVHQGLNSKPLDTSNPGAIPGSIVLLDEKDRPDSGHAVYKYALQIEAKNGMQYQYLVRPGPTYRKTHPKMCPGVYRFRMWAKYTSDYDGSPMLLHLRFFQDDNGKSGKAGTSFAHPFRKANAGHTKAAIAGGYWPRNPDTWQRIEVSVRIFNPASIFQWYIAYPFQADNGKVWVTGLSAVRLGGDGSCE